MIIYYSSHPAKRKKQSSAFFYNSWSDLIKIKITLKPSSGLLSHSKGNLSAYKAMCFSGFLFLLWHCQLLLSTCPLCCDNKSALLAASQAFQISLTWDVFPWFSPCYLLGALSHPHRDSLWPSIENHHVPDTPYSLSLFNFCPHLLLPSEIRILFIFIVVFPNRL